MSSGMKQRLACSTHYMVHSESRHTHTHTTYAQMVMAVGSHSLQLSPCAWQHLQHEPTTTTWKNESTVDGGGKSALCGPRYSVGVECVDSVHSSGVECVDSVHTVYIEVSVH